MGKTNLYLLQYNQFYNKIVKREKTLENYLPYVVYSSEDYQLSNTAFNPSDGINTKHIVNTADSAYDYLLVTDEEGNIQSRWFVVEADYERGQGVRVSAQYSLSLHRDLLADYYDDVISAVTFVEKAYLPSVDNPLIYNSEGFQCNQIKTRETLLKDATNTPWVVCYVGRDLAKDTQQTVTTITAGTDTQYEYSLSALRALGTLYGPIQSDVNTIFRSTETVLSGQGIMEPWWVEYNSNRTHAATLGSSNYNIKRNQSYSYSAAGGVRNLTANTFADNMAEHQDLLRQQFYNYFPQTNNTDLIYQLQQMSGHLIKDTDAENSYFTFDIRFTNNVYVDTALPVNSELFNVILPEITTISGLSYNASGESNIAINTKVATVAITNIRTSTGVAANLIIPTSTNRQHLQDAPYDILCIPYAAEVPFKLPTGNYTTSAGIAVNIGQALATLEGGFVYDVQLLPYCPCMEYWDEVTNSFDMTIFRADQHYSVIQTADNAIASIAFWCNKSSFNGLVEFTPITNPTDPIEFKIANECDKYRLCSPNYSGIFEFTATKNRGILGFEVNCTYKPQQPYIHINPIFDGLYGADFNDARGLVCSGDFSLPRVNDAWIQYQIQNKSYYDAFQRQIDNMETTYSIQREQAKTAGIINTVTAGISGIGSGAMIGMATLNPGLGITTGALTTGLGAGLSAWGLAQDLKYAEQLQNESLSYSKDMFNFNLQNIQALPNTLTRVSAFDINNKLFPVLEYYTCTDIEKEALRKKLTYNGMTVMTIGTIADYIQTEPTFIQGQIIRIDLAEDYHIAATIASEIHRGIYIQGGAL